ncbi:MAG: sulfurtransferase TusA family protein [Candidatus Auribacterota bacterium]|nr:sulfurtransferase TusA family protein [Candidatus Auribacterota bacterium]
MHREKSDKNTCHTEPVIDLCGKVCPYPVVEVISRIESMKPGEHCTFYVDDPLAIKSIPEELEEFEDIILQVSPKGRFWQINVSIKL